jgi:putative endonuclease
MNTRKDAEVCSPANTLSKLLVWYETYPSIADAIQRETSLKRWPRKWKLDLIETMNPDWEDPYLSF